MPRTPTPSPSRVVSSVRTYFRAAECSCRSSSLSFLLPVFLSCSSSLCAASFSRPKVLLKCITLNWKENSVKVQSVVHEREKRKAKEGTTFFLFRRMNPRPKGEKLLYLLFCPRSQIICPRARAVSCELCRLKDTISNVRDGRKYVVRSYARSARDNFVIRIIDNKL